MTLVYIYAKKWNAHFNIGSTTSYLDVSAPSFESATIAADLIVDQKFHDVLEIPMMMGRSLRELHIIFPKQIISQTNCEITW